MVISPDANKKGRNRLRMFARRLKIGPVLKGVDGSAAKGRIVHCETTNQTPRFPGSLVISGWRMVLFMDCVTGSRVPGANTAPVPLVVIIVISLTFFPTNELYNLKEL